MPNDREPLLERQFLLSYYLGVTFRDYWDMPVSDIKWHLERLQRELTPKEAQGHDDPQSTNRAMPRSPDDRAMAGMDRAQVPARLARFT